VTQLDAPLAPFAALPPAKARLARRWLLAGRAVVPELFARQGLALSRAEQTVLAAATEGLGTRVLRRVASRDGSVRLVVGLSDGEAVETVAMPIGAACVSTQIGCAVRCRFCASGRDGLRRNLTAGEIVEQVVHARRELPANRVVFMGMGEPTHNLEAVLAAVVVLREDGLISPRRLTVSTVGSSRAFARMEAAAVRPALALSLHAANRDLRRWLLPHAPDEEPEALVAAADAYGRASDNPIQVEWTLLAGVNDGDAEVDHMAELLAGVRGYVNFIVWNEVEGAPFTSPPRARIVELVRRVKRRGVLATIRDSAGADVEAACGQLRRRSAV
jgi:23S rRNA (adenine2503-C2)-methyltransferase